MYRAEIRTRIKHLGYLTAAAFAVGAAGLKFVTSAPPPAPTGPLTDYDILFCSARSGAFQYYRWSADTEIVERVTADTAAWAVHAEVGPHCFGLGTSSPDGDSLYLLVSTGGPLSGGGRGQIRAYPNTQTRGDLRGTLVVDGTGSLIGPVLSPGQTRLLDMLLLEDGSVEHGGLDLTDRTRTALPSQHWTALNHHTGTHVLALARRPDEGVDYFRIEARTGAGERLTDSPVDKAWATLRGDSLLFGQGRGGDDEDGSLELVLRHLASGEEERLTDNDWNDYEVQWSPDGRHICWQSEEFGHYQSEIMVMDLRTHRSWNLSRSPGRDFECVFTPDGRAVVYQSLRTGDTDLIIQPVGGGEAVNLSFYPGIDRIAGFVVR